jgi:hypothetical protein
MRMVRSSDLCIIILYVRRTMNKGSLRFKLFLEPHALRDESAIDPRLPSLPVCLTHEYYAVEFFTLHTARQTST